MRLRIAVCWIVLSAWLAGPVFAADAAGNYPNRPIRLVMPNAGGSSNDILGRILAAKLSEVLGQQIVVDNRAGAGGVVGMEIGKNANPDGYTLIVSSAGAMTVAPHIHQRLPYDPVRDFEFVALFVDTPNVLVVTPGLPVKNLREFIAYAKARPGQLHMSTAGAGSQSHIAGAAFMLAAGFDSLHVPYKGGSPSVSAIVAGESQWTLPPAAAVMSLVRTGRLRALAHSLPKRDPMMGDIPAIAETVPGYSWSAWKGLLAPRGTPAPILQRLHAEVTRVAQLPEVREQFAQQGSVVMTDTPANFRRLVQEEIIATGKVVKAAGLKAD